MNRTHFLRLAALLGLVVAAHAAGADSAPSPTPAAPATPDSARPATPAETPDPRSFSNPHLTKEEQEAADAKLRKELAQARIDSLHLNQNPRLFLHAVPTSLHRSAAEVAKAVRDCDSVVTGVPPGEWDVFVIAAGHDMMNGVAFSFGWPADWVIRGFSLSPDLKTPFTMGDLKAQDLRPTMIAFDCIANQARVDAVPEKARYVVGDIVVIGKLEIVATSPGSLTLLDHSDPRYGPPEISNCWNKTQDIPIPSRGRIDVGSGPGVRPCDAGGPLVPNLMAQAPSAESKKP
jgi:hypothetical protein